MSGTRVYWNWQYLPRIPGFDPFEARWLPKQKKELDKEEKKQEKQEKEKKEEETQPPAAPQSAPPQPPAPKRQRALLLKLAGDGGFARVDACDYVRAYPLSWCRDSDGYVSANNRKAYGGDGRPIRLHALVLGRKEGYVIDHKNGDKSDCRRANLRHVRISQNSANRSAHQQSRSGIRGVHGGPLGWQVRFTKGYKALTLGLYADLGQARLVANTAMGLIYGEGTRLVSGEPFDQRHVEQIVSDASGIAPKAMRRLLTKTAGLGDELSAELRTQLAQRFISSPFKGEGGRAAAG